MGEEAKVENFNWKKIDRATSRARVPGGWLVRYVSGIFPTMEFVPDEEHEWTRTTHNREG